VPTAPAPVRAIVAAPNPADWRPGAAPLFTGGRAPAAGSSAAADVSLTSAPWAGGLTEKPAPSAGPELTAVDLYAKLRDSVFLVVAAESYERAITRDGDHVTGSAVAISKHVLITNWHVVEGARAIVVYGRSGFARVRVLKGDKQSDRCALEVVDGRELVRVPGVRDARELKVGERVYSLGAPEGYENTLGEGIVSGLPEEKGRLLIQTTAQVSHGSSGGGLFDASGNLVGITALKQFSGESLNFALPAADFWAK
jgi:S1-C subfamily serine protease